MSIKFTSYPLDGICRLQMGKTPKRVKAEYWGEGFPWVSIADMKAKTVETTKEQITAKAVEECGCKMVRKGTLLLSFKLSIGKLAFAGTDLYTNEAIVALYIRDFNEVYPEYLYYALKTIPLTGKNKAAKGSTLNSKSLKKIRVPIPDKYEDQIRIAQILKQVENIVEERSKSINVLEDFLKSKFYQLFGEPVTNEKQFPIRKLSEFYINKKDGTKCGPFGSALKKSEFQSNGIPVWNMDNIDDSGKFVDNTNLFISSEKFETLRAYNAINGDVIISRAGTVGKMCVLESKHNQSVISTNLIRVRLGSELSPLFFVSFMKYWKGRIKRLKTGPDGSLTHMNTGILDNLRFPYPSIKIQELFVSIFRKVEKVKNEYVASLNDLDFLNKSVSQKIFSGKLDLNKLDVGDIMMSFFRHIENTPPLYEKEKKEIRPRTTKVDNVTFNNYYEDDLATLIKNHFGKFHFRFKDIEEMFAEEEGGVITYFTTQELKRMKEKAPKDIHTFIFDCVEKKSKNLKLNQIFYNALTDLNLKKIKLKAGNETVLQQINDKQISREELSGIYFQIVR